MLSRHGNNVVLFNDAIADIDLEPIDFEHFVDDIDDGQGRKLSLLRIIQTDTSDQRGVYINIFREFCDCSVATLLPRQTIGALRNFKTKSPFKFGLPKWELNPLHY